MGTKCSHILDKIRMLCRSFVQNDGKFVKGLCVSCIDKMKNIFYNRNITRDADRTHPYKRRKAKKEKPL